MILECALTHVLCQHFPDCNNGCDDSSDVFPLLLPVASSESWADSYKEWVPFFLGDNMMLQWNTINNWSSYPIKWKYLYLLSEIAFISLFLIAVKKYNNQKAACRAWKSLFLCMLSDHRLFFRKTGTWKQVIYLFSPYGLLIFPSYTT